MSASQRDPVDHTLRTPFHHLRRLALLGLALGIPLIAASQSQDSYFAGRGPQHVPGRTGSPLIDKVRHATAKYRDINVALSGPQPWAPATPCVSGPETGAMGVHFIRSAESLADGVLDPEEPELLIYEPLPNGAMRLVGVEFIQFAAEWAELHKDDGKATPDVEGNLMNYVGAPNRYGLPAFYELHVWAWQDNPKGSFADWNTLVTCEKQPTD